MTHVLIYSPIKSAPQSGRAKDQFWHIKPTDGYEPYQDPLMGWFGSFGTMNQVCMRFHTKDAAIAFARKQDWNYEVLENSEKIIQPKNYADNFK